MSEKQLQNLTKHFYISSKKYCTEKVTCSGLYDWEQFIFDKYIPAGASDVVVLAAGGGRELYALTQMGYKCYGYELNRQFVSFAKDFFAKENMNVGIDHFPPDKIPEHPCDVFVFGWGVYSHFMGENLRIQLLEEAKNNLRENGKIVIAFWANNNEWKSNKIKRMEKFKRLFRGKFERGATVDRGCWGKFYTKNEIENEAQKAGLKIDYISSRQYGHAVLSVKKE
ncbi:MAG: class I SAM-dependent methyltransferase [Dysgonamonadaceae bacterium]|jgi:SAM-dependent methyltransferase|nr:class I SAM-dependent methyltransferase [Dysgonamonadaceae bacterium]